MACLSLPLAPGYVPFHRTDRLSAVGSRLRPVTNQLQLVRAYVDETGDRGTSAKSSRHFAMAAIVVADEDEPALRAAVARCRAQLNVPVTKPLHWIDHVKKYARRAYVTRELAAVPNIVLNYVIFEKAAIPLQSALMKDQVVSTTMWQDSCWSGSCSVRRTGWEARGTWW